MQQILSNLKLYQKIIAAIFPVLLPSFFYIYISQNQKDRDTKVLESEIEGVAILRKIHLVKFQLEDFHVSQTDPRQNETIMSPKDVGVLLDGIEESISIHNRQMDLFKFYFDTKIAWLDYRDKSIGRKLGSNDEYFRKLLLNSNILSREAIQSTRLILDSETKTYYIMTLCLEKIPQVSESLMNLSLLTYEMLSQKKLTSSELVSWALYKGKLSSLESELTEIYSIIIRENDHLEKELATHYLQYIQNLNKAINYLDVTLQNDYPPQNLAALILALNEAKKESKSFYTILSPILKNELGKRLDRMNQENRNHQFIALFLIFISLSIMFLIIKNITRPTTRIRELIKDLSEGDGNLVLRLPVEGKDENSEISFYLNNFLDKLSLIVTNLTIIGKRISSTSEKLNNSAQSVAETSLFQASSSEQASASIEELSTSFETVVYAVSEEAKSLKEIDQNLKSLSNSISSINSNLLNLGQVAQNSTKLAEAGRNSITESTYAMQKIQEVSQEISGIAGIITEISDQTNLLSLNASIEAARAGEHGRGFAVVAQEISKLSIKTVSAISDIYRLIKATELSVKNGTDHVNNSVNFLAKIIESIEIINSSTLELSESMNQQSTNTKTIAEDLSKIYHQASEIEMTTQEQKTSSVQLSKLMFEIASETNQLTEGSEDLSKMSGTLAQVSMELNNELSKFRIS